MNNSRSCKRIGKCFLKYIIFVLIIIAISALLMQCSNVELQYTNNESTTEIISIKGEESIVTIDIPSDTVSKEINYWDYLHFNMVSYFTIGYGDIIILSSFGKLILWVEMIFSLVINAGFIAFLVMELMKPKDEVVIYHSVFLQQKDKHITVPIKNYGKTLVDAQFKLEFGVDDPTKDETNYLKSISDSKPFFNVRKQLSIKNDKDSEDFDAFIEQLVSLKGNEKMNIRVFISGMCINTGSKLAKSETFTIEKDQNGEFDNVFVCNKLHILESDISGANKKLKGFFGKYLKSLCSKSDKSNEKIDNFQNVKAIAPTVGDGKSKFENFKSEDKCKINNNMTKEKFKEKFFGIK